MTRWQLAVASLVMFLGLVPQARANWFSCGMNPYPQYGHPSFYFPPAMAAFYAGYGYTSLLPGGYYAPTATPGYTVTYQACVVTRYRPVYVPCVGAFYTVQWTCVMVPYLETVT